jgi:tetratricopeptide (TPR) repeat protein
VLEALGRSDEALPAYFRALAADPSSASPGRRAAALQLDRGQSDQALARLTHVLELVPGDPDALYHRGRAHLAMGHAAEAVADLKEASAARPDRADIFYQLALALERDQKAVAAREAAQQALALAPGNEAVRTLAERLVR